MDRRTAKTRNREVPPPPIPAAAALRLFVNSGIGGEPIPSTATSELMLRTVTKAIGSAATLVDSPALGLAGAKPVTKTIRGAGVGVYLLSETLAGRGIKRGLGLFVLALGGALVAIALITGSAPAWMATLGFGLLLGGLAYAALASGSFALALVLATPVVPLLVWSATQSDGSEESGSTPIVQIVLIALLVGTVLIMGTVRDPAARPTRWLNLRPFVYLLMAVLLVVTIAVVVHAVVVELPVLWSLVMPWLAAAAVLVLAVLALLHAQRVGRRATAVQGPGATDVAATSEARGQTASSFADPQGHGSAEGAATAAGWAWVFGAVYVVLAVVTLLALRRYPDAAADVETLLRSLLATFTVLAAVCFVLCLRIKRPAESLLQP